MFGAKKTIIGKGLILLLSLCTFWTLTGGCASLLPKPPVVTLAGIEVLTANLFEQRFALKLRLQNPNKVAITLRAMKVAVEINGQPFAVGVSKMPVTVNSRDEEILEVTVVSDLSGALLQMMELLHSGGKVLTYRIRGRMVSDSFGDFDFDKSGRLELSNPAQSRSTVNDNMGRQ